MPPFIELIIYLRVAQAFKARLQIPDRDRAQAMAVTSASALKKRNHSPNFAVSSISKQPRSHAAKLPFVFDTIEDPDFEFFLRQIPRKLDPEQSESQILLLSYRCGVIPSDYKTNSK
jgi:hypothetical protein